MIRIAVVDDIEFTSKSIKTAIENYDFGVRVEVDSFVSGTDLLQKEKQKHYDILILDVELTKEHQKIEENHPDTPIIYITGTACHIREDLQHEPFCYLEKPFEMEEICQAVRDAIGRIMNNNRSDQLLFIRMGGVSCGINVKRIQYFMSNRRKIIVFSVDESFDYYEKMNDLEKRVSALTDCFLRVGKSYLVNMRHIKKSQNRR